MRRVTQPVWPSDNTVSWLSSQASIARLHCLPLNLSMNCCLGCWGRWGVPLNGPSAGSPSRGKPKMKDKRSLNNLSLVGRSLTLHRQKSSFGRAWVCSLKMFATFYKKSNHIKQFGVFIYFPGCLGAHRRQWHTDHCPPFLPLSRGVYSFLLPLSWLAQPHPASDGPSHPLKALPNKEKLSFQLPLFHSS